MEYDPSSPSPDPSSSSPDPSSSSPDPSSPSPDLSHPPPNYVEEEKAEEAQEVREEEDKEETASDGTRRGEERSDKGGGEERGDKGGGEEKGDKGGEEGRGRGRRSGGFDERGGWARAEEAPCWHAWNTHPGKYKQTETIQNSIKEERERGRTNE